MKVKIKTSLLKELRKRQQLTQEQLAEIADLHPRTIQRMESEGVVAVKTLNAVANVLQVEAYSLEVATDEVDFGPLLVELRVLLLAITRKLLPKDIRALPNSLIAVLTLLSFSASFTFINAVITVVNQPQQNFDSIVNSGLFALVILFCTVYVAVVYPLFKLKSWARVVMMSICIVFLIINLSLIVTETLTSSSTEISLLLEYLFNILVVTWIYRILNRDDIKRLYQVQKLPDI